MINPYALSAINLCLSALLLSGVLIYKYVYPKKKLNLFILLILISILPIWSIFRPGVYESGDFSLHVTQLVSFYKSLTEGIIVPRWAGDLNATYGFPAFIFIYPLPYYLASFFHLLGFTFIDSIKVLLASSFVISGIGMYLWVKEEANNLAGFIAATFYLFTPYHLVDLHFRSDIGEVLSFAILPFILLLIKRSFNKSSKKNFVFISILFALLILSHPAISLASTLLIFTYMFFLLFQNKYNKGSFITLLIYLFLGILISAFYWLPTIYNLRFTHETNKIYFESLSSFLFSPWRLGFLFQGPKGELSFLIGYLQIGVIVYSMYMLITNKVNSFTKYLLLIFFLYFVLMQKFLEPLWNIVPLVKNFQFTYRLSFYTSLISSVIAAFSLYRLTNKRIIALICALTIITSVLNWGNRKVIPSVHDSSIINNLALSTVNGGGLAQASPIWTDPNKPWVDSIPKSHLEVINGKSDTKEIYRGQAQHVYILDVKENSSFQENTLFFPGWGLYANTKKINTNISTSSPKGVITFNLKKGIYKLDLRYEDTYIIRFANLVTLIGVFMLFISLPKLKINISNKFPR